MYMKMCTCTDDDMHKNYTQSTKLVLVPKVQSTKNIFCIVLFLLQRHTIKFRPRVLKFDDGGYILLYVLKHLAHINGETC